jgi:prepilin peptidase CpaA
MLRVISDSLSAELGGTHWGLLPALLGYYWLITWGGGVMPTGMWLLLASLVASYDLADRRIPNVLNIWIAVAGLTYQATSAGFAALLPALLAGLIGFGLMSIFFFFGAVGGGDVKALGALATFLSPWGAVNLFILTTFAGGLLALALFLPAIIRWVSEGMVPGEIRQYTKRMSMPYGLAIFGGVLAMIL